jgi:gliding motility-associated lipoprotein GldH
MRIGILTGVLILLLFSCGQRHEYREYIDFDDRIWLASEGARFSFEISDTVAAYNIYCNLRNSTHYPWSRVFVTFLLTDTVGTKYEEKLVTEFLFDPKTGKPFGTSGLGDLYDHRITVLSNYQFPGSGPFEVRFDQSMRTDSLKGILSVGLAIEKVTNSN